MMKCRDWLTITIDSLLLSCTQTMSLVPSSCSMKLTFIDILSLHIFQSRKYFLYVLLLYLVYSARNKFLFRKGLTSNSHHFHTHIYDYIFIIEVHVIVQFVYKKVSKIVMFWSFHF